MFELRQGDALELLKALPDNSIDAIVSDPPAGIAFMGKEWDKNKGGRDEWVKWLSEVMAEALRVLKPGGYGLVWALPRTSHWTAWALEDAGFVVKDRLAHLFGSGFPKSLSIDKALDKMAGAEREVVGQRDTFTGQDKMRNTFMASPRLMEITAPATDAAKQWEGWGTALKPAVEDWWWVQKPLSVVPETARIASETTLLVEALLWWLSPARLVEQSSELSLSALGAEYGSVRWLAAVSHTLGLLENSGVTATFSSQVGGSTFSSIASSWNSILVALLAQPNTFTTETETRLITALKTLNSLILATTPESITKVAYLQGGLWQPVETAGRSTSDSAYGWKHIPKPSAPGGAIRLFGHAIATTLAEIAGECSTLLQASSANSAKPSVTTNTEGLTEKLSPSVEDWWLVQKPFPSTYAENVLAWGVGGLNVDGCRVAIEADHEGGNYKRAGKLYDHDIRIYGSNFVKKGSAANPYYSPSGRWPPNLLLEDTPEVLAHFPQTASGKAPKDGFKRNPDTTKRNTYGSFEGVIEAGELYGDSGSAARFYPRFAYDAEDVEIARVLYCSKATKRDRDEGLGGGRNGHPTVKSTALMQWLCRLITPPGGTILDPFMGSGSTLKAAVLEGFDCIGFDLDEEYIAIARARCEWAEKEYQKQNAQPRLELV